MKRTENERRDLHQEERPLVELYHPFGNPLDDVRKSHVDFDTHDFGSRRRTN